MKKLSLALAALMVVGCTHLPKEEAKPQTAPVPNRLSVTNAEQTLVKGKTTKKEVMEKIGVPNSIRRKELPATDQAQAQTPAVAETWYYWTAPSTQAVRQGGEQPIFRMEVYYDKDGVVLDYKAADGSVIIR